MLLSFDPAKSEVNAKERGLPFERAADFEFETALIGEDRRQDYGETRWLALGLIGGRVHGLCYTERDDGIRVISLRKANSREVKAYERARALTDEDGEIREITADDLKHFKRFHELPETMQRTLRAIRGPQKEPTKQQISLRVSRDVLGRFRATGPGWQGRMDDALREWIDRKGAQAG